MILRVIIRLVGDERCFSEAKLPNSFCIAQTKRIIFSNFADEKPFTPRYHMTKREIKERTNLNNKIRFKFTYYGTDCEYRIKTFYDARRILNECDLEIQEKFIDLMNQLIDEKIIGWENPC